MFVFGVGSRRRRGNIMKGMTMVIIVGIGLSNTSEITAACVGM